MQAKLAAVKEVYKQGQLVLEKTKNKTEILEYMKRTRTQDMVIKKYPFIQYNHLLPQVMSYIHKRQNWMVMDHEHINRLLIKLENDKKYKKE
jgi:hypothetical protein